MIAEIYHKTTNNQEDELTGNFFGTMRYLSFTRGLKPIFERYVKSDDPAMSKILEGISAEEFELEFWKRSENGLGEIDGYLQVANVGIGIEVKYHSGLSGENQLEREARMLRDEWCQQKERLLLFVGDEESSRAIYKRNCNKSIFQEVHLGYITWQDIYLGLDDLEMNKTFECLMISDLKDFLKERGLVPFKGFEILCPVIEGGMSMTSGENIHNAFVVVYKTLQSVEKLMIKCRAELDTQNYYMPAERFMRYSTDLSWEG